MCEMDNQNERGSYRDKDPPRMRNKSTENLLKEQFVHISRSTPSSPISQQRGAILNLDHKCLSEPEFSKSYCGNKVSSITGIDASSSNDYPKDDAPNNRDPSSDSRTRTYAIEDSFVKELVARVPAILMTTRKEVVFNCGNTNESVDSCSKVTNGKDMAPVLGVPPPPPAPHMGPDGLILPRKPNNPYLESKNHKDLHRELIFNAKVGRNVLNQKSELDRALEKQREAASRKEAERIREESFKDDPRTVLQRAMEQRARHIRLTEQPQNEEPPNPLVTARAKLRTRTDSQ